MVVKALSKTRPVKYGLAHGRNEELVVMMEKHLLLSQMKMDLTTIGHLVAIKTHRENFG
tara:strand:+ start:1977 stop:2153 length:177 start_codon:yes stop_codon:yes gene_type:complete